MSDEKPCFVDTETCGLSGPAVLIQYAFGDGEIHLHSVFTSMVSDTLELIERIANHPGGIVGYNLSFDVYQLQKIHSILRLVDPYSYPEDIVEELVAKEEKAFDGPCFKPIKAMDLMLHARKGPYQSTMDRDDVRIRRVPTQLAQHLANELERRVPLKDIFFAKRKDKTQPKWKVDNILHTTDFKNVTLRFAPTSALKALATDALGLKKQDTLLFADVGVPDAWMPEESGFALSAKGAKRTGAKFTWDKRLSKHIETWAYNELSRKYAWMDVDLTRRLYYAFGSPPLGDDDSELACQVGSTRHKGFAVNLEGIKKLLEAAKIARGKTQISPRGAMAYISEVCDDTMKLALTNEHGIPSTKRTVLETLAKFTDDDDKPTPAALRAKEVLDARKAEYSIDFYTKLLAAERFHATMTVIGTKSSRGGGGAKNVEQKRAKKSGGINSQGIKKSKDVRGCFPLAFEDEVLCGGDFDAFEITIAEAYYQDPQLTKDLTTIDPKTGEPFKLHGLMGTEFYPGKTYEEILASDGSNVFDYYTRAKSGVFALIYMGNEHTLQTRLAIEPDPAKTAFLNVLRRYPMMAKKREKFKDLFCPMRQEGGLGSRITWSDPSDYIESMLGFKRFFTLENQICKALFEMAQAPPEYFRTFKMRVQRRREGADQSAFGAVQSSLYGAAFQLQAANMRAAGNHVIQSTGAQITKGLQRRIWDLQPSGIHEWVVRPLNSHDELMVACQKQVQPKVKEVVTGYIQEMRKIVPLLNMTWHDNMTSWAGKKKKEKPKSGQAA